MDDFPVDHRQKNCLEEQKKEEEEDYFGWLFVIKKIDTNRAADKLEIGQEADQNAAVSIRQQVRDPLALPDYLGQDD